MIRYFFEFEIACIMLDRYSIGNVENEHIVNTLSFLGKGCVSLMREYVGTRHTSSPLEWKDIDNEYCPAIKAELTKLKIFDMETCNIRVKMGSSGHYSMITVTADLH